MKITKPISEMSTGHLRKLRLKLERAFEIRSQEQKQEYRELLNRWDNMPIEKLEEINEELLDRSLESRFFLPLAK